MQEADIKDVGPAVSALYTGLGSIPLPKASCQCISVSEESEKWIIKLSMSMGRVVARNLCFCLSDMDRLDLRSPMPRSPSPRTHRQRTADQIEMLRI